MDSWLAGVDAVSRVHSEMLCACSPRARGRGLRFWYYVFLVVMVGVTWAVLPIRKEPDAVLTLTGVISLFAVAIFSVGLWILNYVHLPRRFPEWIRTSLVQRILLALVILFYLSAAVYYLAVRLRVV
jgi:hypothetical protein